MGQGEEWGKEGEGKERNGEGRMEEREGGEGTHHKLRKENFRTKGASVSSAR
jgi:hypothetical protein